MREFVLTTVILPPGVGNPGSVLHGLTPFQLDPVDQLDQLQNPWRLKKEQQSYGFGTFARKTGTHFEFEPEKMC